MKIVYSLQSTVYSLQSTVYSLQLTNYNNCFFLSYKKNLLLINKRYVL